VFHLIITVMSIALAAGTALITLSYLDPTLPLQRQSEQRIEAGFEAFQEAWARYSEVNKTHGWQCDEYTSADTGAIYEDCQKVVIDPGYLAADVNWKTALIPEYTFLPRAPEGLTYTYNKNDIDGWYFCAQGSINSAQLKGVYRAKNNFPVDSYFVSSTCGDTSSQLQENVDSSAVKITYWVKRN